MPQRSCARRLLTIRLLTKLKPISICGRCCCKKGRRQRTYNRLAPYNRNIGRTHLLFAICTACLPIRTTLLSARTWYLELWSQNSKASLR